MFNNDEDDDTPVAVDPELDTEIADAEGADEDDEADVTAAARKPKRAGAKKRGREGGCEGEGAKAGQVRHEGSAGQGRVQAGKEARKGGKGEEASREEGGQGCRRRRRTSAGVKAGAHTLWVSKDLAGALTSKDRRKLKALLKRAEKRRKAQKK